MFVGCAMRDDQYCLDRGRDGNVNVSQRLAQVLDDLDERLNVRVPSAEMAASFEAFGRAMRDIDENVRQISRVISESRRN
jgi:hypothetical protein